MGALGTQIIGRDGQRGPWQNLGATDSYLRSDNKGFHLVFLDPNPMQFLPTTVENAGSELPGDQMYSVESIS